MKKRITMCIDKEIVDDIEKIRGIASKSAFINSFLKKYLTFQSANEILRGDAD
jgi:hypothetical protein